MAEVITETIVPGTYIEVRAEGLLTVGGIATGNIGVLGTAEKGTDQIKILSSFDEGKAEYGEIGGWDPKDLASNLTLVRTLKLLFDNGARTVYAQRVFDPSKAKPATYALSNESGGPVLKLRAKTPGIWANRLQVRIESAEGNELVSDERVARSNGTFTLSALKVLEPPQPPAGPGTGTAALPEPSLGTLVLRENNLLNRYPLKKNPAVPQESYVQINPSTRTLTFVAQPSTSAEISASYWVPQDSLRKVTFRFGNVQEVYVVPSLSYLAQLLRDESNPSKLLEVEEINGDGLSKPTARFETFANGDNGTVSPADFESGLDNFVAQNVQILIVPRRFTDIKAAILAHVEKTENLGRERIAVVGADSSEVAKIQENANEVADKRVVLVGPGIKQQDSQTGQLLSLPPYFAAAAVAGKLSSLPPHVSLTNKTLAGIDGLAEEYNYGQLTALLQDRVLVLQKKRGIRVVKGITTHDEAFKQITLRRIVDYLKEGTRLGANQYIGKLNNPRVRGALHTTLNGFLTAALTDELLTGFKLQVFADRSMEIRGEVRVTMDLMPTFSIDVVRVIMNLS